MYVHITDIMDVNVDSKVENHYAKNGAHQMNAIYTQQCVIDDGAPDDRANKCSLNNREHLFCGRRRMLALQDTMTGIQCNCVSM